MSNTLSDGTTNNSSYRLPSHIVPHSYQVTIAPNLTAGTFNGEIAIAIRNSKAVSEIILNAADLVITNAVISKNNGTELLGKVKLDSAAEQATISVDGAVGKGNWTINLAFHGVLNDQLRGFYRSTYSDANGVNQIIATTQFESTDARRAFPCFDEPAMKATFQLTMIVDENLAAISNMAVVSERIVERAKTIRHEGEIVVDENGLHYEGGWQQEIPAKKAVTFAPTIKMSSYIVAFINGDLSCTKPIYVGSTPIRVWCVPGKEHLATFALEVAQFALTYFQQYFAVAYPGDKLDLIAIPDFAAGAMENLGCVTFRENALLLDAASASQAALDWVAEVVSHELAHMWFGDLVTMRWWNGLWLNEAFATFMAAKCVDAFKQHWGVWDKFGLSRGSAFRIDGLHSSRPVEFTVNHPDDAQGMFDILTYEKGCSVMRMLEQFIGADTFQKGIASYINAHAYGNTETADLWAALETASGQPIGEIMRGWIFEAGYPVLTVSPGTTSGSIQLQQQRFTYLPADTSEKQHWRVPVLLRYKDADGIHERKHLLRSESESIYLGEKLEWVIANAGGHGFYRVLYSPALRAQLTADVQTTLLVIERVNLLLDAWACVQSGQNSSLEFLELAKHFADENDPNVWSALTGPLATIRRLLPADRRNGFEKMVQNLVNPVLARLGWQAKEDESPQTGELRGSMIGTLAIIGDDPQVRARAQQLFADWKADSKSVDNDVIGAVINIVANSGDNAVYDEFYRLFKDARTPEDSERFLYALAKFRDSKLIARTLEACLHPEEIRTQDAPSVLSLLVSSEIGGPAAWQFIKNNWEKMVTLYPDSGVVGLMRATASFNTASQEEEVKEWFANHPVKAAGKAVEQTLEQLRISVLLRQRETPILSAAYLPENDSENNQDGPMPEDPPALEPGS